MTLEDSIQAAHLSGPHLEADGRARFEFRFAAEDPVFAGHFPEHPILPGIFQLELARLAAQAVLQCKLRLCEVTRAKFRLPVSPGETLNLELSLTDSAGGVQLRARYSVAGQLVGETCMGLVRAT